MDFVINGATRLLMADDIVGRTVRYLAGTQDLAGEALPDPRYDDEPPESS